MSYLSSAPLISTTLCYDLKPVHTNTACCVGLSMYQLLSTTCKLQLNATHCNSSLNDFNFTAKSHHNYEVSAVR